MSILIKGMKMPQNCLLCPFGNEFGECCVNTALEDANELTHSCLLIELPDHGELLDKDELSRLVGESFEYFLARLGLKCPKAIIPAERSEDQFHPFADSVKMGERSEDGET